MSPAAAATSSLSKPEQQASQQNGGVQVLQVRNFVMCRYLLNLLLLKCKFPSVGAHPVSMSLVSKLWKAAA